MSKYIIDVGDGYIRHGLERTLTIPVRINEHEDHWMDTRIPVTPYTEPDLDKIRCEAYEEGRNSLLIEVQKAGAIKVGDEVTDDKGDTGICTEISYPANSMHILYADGTATDISLTGVTKTGNDFPEVVELLKKMRGETNSKPKAKKQSKQIPGQMSLF